MEEQVITAIVKREAIWNPLPKHVNVLQKMSK